MPSAAGWWYPATSALTNDRRPFHTFLLKIASRCNLDCPYCYVYHLADQSWRKQPRFMEPDVVRATGVRIGEYARQNGKSSVSVVYHGGEPLLTGQSRLREISDNLRAQVGPDIEIDFGLQTNGTLIDESWVDLFEEYNINVGISVDGPPKRHDRFRVYVDGSGSSRAVEAAVALLCARPSVFGGALCVVDLESDPIEVYDYLVSIGVPGIDFLLPDGNHSHLPPGMHQMADAVRYADWLLPIFDRWYQAGSTAPPIRTFMSIMRLLLGRESLVESIGPSTVDLVVVETNGDIEAVDTLKCCYAGAAATGFSVLRDAFDAVESTPALQALRLGLGALGDECMRCKYVRVCGGGYQPHRYSADRGFLNPSIYCVALQRLIGSIAGRLEDDLRAAGLAVPSRITDLANALSPSSS